ncbi:MAG: hypothetical protein Q4B54_09015 [Coriobacteriales bacterium]|nr:hypothetical protein [Coriobacteriales bacterium]
MSKKATKTSRAAAKALAVSRRSAELSRQATEATRLAKDAINAAIAAACTADRARGADKSADAANARLQNMRGLIQDVRSAAEDAVERAKDAMRAESTGDLVGAVHSAKLSLDSARRANSLAAAISVKDGASKAQASGRDAAEPKLTEAKVRKPTGPGREADALACAIERAACYLVTFDGAIIASFMREEDAFLFESELADLNRAHGVTSGKCEVIDRKSGHRLGGYMLSAGQLLVFLRDDEAAGKFGKRR